MSFQGNSFRNEILYKHFSAKKKLKIYVPGFAFKHDDSMEGKEKFVGREVQQRRLFTWLTSESKSGSYLITGYRGMGKSLLVNRVIQSITRGQKAWKELVYRSVIFFLLLASAFLFQGKFWLSFATFMFSLVAALLLYFSKEVNGILYKQRIRKFPNVSLFAQSLISKFIIKNHDRRGRRYNRIAITINIGQEVMGERDVLSLIATNVRKHYKQYISNHQNRPLLGYFISLLISIPSSMFCKGVLMEGLYYIKNVLLDALGGMKTAGNLFDLFVNSNAIRCLAVYGSYLLTYYVFSRLIKLIRNKLPYVSVPFKSIRRLDDLCERISATVEVEKGAEAASSRHKDNGSLNVSMFKRKRKSYPMADVREIEQELMDIINNINGENCPLYYRVQFIVVFDELDKLSDTGDPSDSVGRPPHFDASLLGFSDAGDNEKRKQQLLNLLANMKLFIATVHVKFVFISGYELFDASLADLSDREFAISSIFNGVMNVNSFLSPERDQNDVSSMTELYLATMLLPDEYLQGKIWQNAIENKVVKDEMPSLRWYNEYLMQKHVLDQDRKGKEVLKERVNEIRFAVEFLRNFSVFLAHISNGSPKKIATYFEKYIKIDFDTIRPVDWQDEVVVGVPTEEDIRQRCVLYFDVSAQKFINFIAFIAAPVMNIITNDVSHYGDKLLVSSSFILDHIYKYHRGGFSWRNLEQLPELLSPSKTPELRDSMLSVMEFLLQTHISEITSGVFQYKFHKQISEEVSYLSKVSEEASALFNFTLNEMETVKRYNVRLLNHYLQLAEKSSDKSKYNQVLQRIHENMGDLYFSEEDYYRSIQEYKNALNHLEKDSHNPLDVIAYIKCSLKIGMAYEYRHTYENAYVIYCRIINELVHIRWIDEEKFGMDCTIRTVPDWRSRKSVLCHHRGCSGKMDDTVYHKEFPLLLFDDSLKDSKAIDHSIDSDSIISGMSMNFTPEKSDLIRNLSLFEDVKFVYQAIIAKMLVAEKMEGSGLTQSGLDLAETEFQYLHEAIDVEDQFMISADFFKKMAEVLYYKNNLVFTADHDTLVASLYTFDINVFEFLDNYCASLSSGNAIILKDKIRKALNDIKSDSVLKNDASVETEKADTFIGKLYNESDTDVHGYLRYLAEKWRYKMIPVKKLASCSQRRQSFKAEGCQMPCNACKYANRSLEILMQNMFEPPLSSDSLAGHSKAVRLILFTSHKKVRHLRQSQVRLLASVAEQMGDIMLSCSRTRTDGREDAVCDRISEKVLKLLIILSGEDKINDAARFDLVKTKYPVDSDSKLDRALLYYWAAYRYYDIANLYREAGHCIERVLGVLDNYLKVLNSSEENKKIGNAFCEWLWKGSKEKESNKVGQQTDSECELIANLFRIYVSCVSQQYDNFNLSEIHEYKWLFHLEHSAHIDLSKLLVYPEIRKAFLTAIDVKIQVLMYLKKASPLEYDNKINDYIVRVYDRIAPKTRHDVLFSEEVQGYYLKAYVNRIIFYALLKDFELNKTKINLNENLKEFAKGLNDFCNKKDKDVFESMFGSTGSVRDRIGIVEFLIHDSVVCLSEVLSVITPHNHLTSFSDMFVGEVYELMWEWSKLYEFMYEIHLFRKYEDDHNESAKMSLSRLLLGKKSEEVLDKEFYSNIKITDSIPAKDSYGYPFTHLFMNIRHDVDDATMHHIFTNYSAEMAVKYYTEAKEANIEGVTYKRLISSLYVLNDDLDNDTCKSNLADERYFLNSKVIDDYKTRLEKIYRNNSVKRIGNYEKFGKEKDDDPYKILKDRFDDSIYCNTEY